MATIRVKRFGEGIADDVYAAGSGQFAYAKHFDTLTYPDRLYPLRGMAADTASTGIGNVIVVSDGSFWGIGADASGTPTNGSLWKRGASSWSQVTHTSGDPVSYNLLVEYHKSDGTRQLFYATTTNAIKALDLADIAIVSHSLTFTNVAQGVVHPEDDCLYIPYDNKIAKNNNGTWTDTAFTAPANYRITSVKPFGRFLSIALTPSVNGVDYGGSGANSVEYLWDRDTSLTTVSESYDWGSGQLKWTNELDGVMIGISQTSGNTSNVLERDSIKIMARGQSVPILELSTDKQTTTVPSVSINPRVNFKHNKRLYFSIDVVGGSTSPALHGLFSIGRSKRTGRFVVNLERVATTDNSETAVLAAAISGDKCVMVYNAEGTLSITNTTSGTGAQYTATSDYQSAVNPEMMQQAPDDFDKVKQLSVVAAYFRPLTASGQVDMQYRVDGGSWTTIFTKTTSSPDSNTNYCERSFDTNGDKFASGIHYEFRVKSTGGAQIVGYDYKYDTLKTQL